MNKATQDIRYRKTKDFGNFREVENLFCTNLGNDKKRKKKQKETPAAVRKVNERKAVEQVEDKIKMNFRPRDWFITLGYFSDRQPETEAEAVKNINNFSSRLKRYCVKHGIEFKWLKTTEQGERSGKWHSHMILPGSIKLEDIERIWGMGNVFPRRLWTDTNTAGSDRLNVHNLAEYFVGTKKRREENRPSNKKRYSFSRNCTSPKITYEVMSPRWKKTPRPPAGWTMAPNSLVEYKDSYGYSHQKYTLVKIRC